jgi:heme exporter protein D
MNPVAWPDFLALGGYGPYVWGAYLIALAVVVVELVLLRARRRNILRHLGAARRSASRTSVDAAGRMSHRLG